MMSVIVKGMKMPKDCYDCPLHDGETGRCNILRITVFDYMPKECPLVEEDRKKGKWLSHYEYCKRKGYNPSGLIAFWWCDLCEQGVEHPTNFCPKCGATMREREEQ